MIIDIGQYIDIIQDAYVHYDKKHFPEADSLSFFSDKYQKMKGKMVEDARAAQMQAIIDQNQKKLNGSKDLIELLRSIEFGETLENTLDSIAQRFNESLEKVANNYEAIVAEANTAQNLFNNSPDQSGVSIERFFELIQQAVTMANGKVSKRFVDILSKGAEDFKTAEFIGEKLITEEANVLKMLNNAQQILKTVGSIDSKSFSSTITNIFSTTLGEKAAATMLKQFFNEQGQNIENSLMSVKSIRPKVVGSKTTKDEGRVSKVDVLSGKTLSLKLINNSGKEIAIEIATNLSVKWYASKDSQIHIVNSTPLKRYIGDEKGEKYYTYNTFYHYGGGKGSSEAFRAMRASLAATFFDEWLSGGGQALKNGGINKAQFLMVNGKIYSVMSIIKNICEELNQLNGFNSAGMPIKVHFSNSKVEWQGDPSVKNWEKAIERSEKIKEIINKIVISASFNKNILTKYAR